VVEADGEGDDDDDARRYGAVLPRVIGIFIILRSSLILFLTAVQENEEISRAIKEQDYII